ncbi:hypothetical protein AB835_07540 [Candidatus Endobugula sertula]|uniref:Uncharacterized protein n=1 Tax=Candidatus Endobugula sertula TaxID=62101 RepID=A0A1D2QPY2_9GAMM|nr:hypothetical protein AB835_07540 [Candidatus Endobugula sertula]
MKAAYEIEIPTNILEKSIDAALSRSAMSRGDFFHEIRAAFKNNMEAIFEANGLPVNCNESLGHTNYLKQGKSVRWSPIVKYTGWNNDIKKELDLEFCSKYGHDNYSLRAINYIDRSPASFPALSSLSDIFSIGNILLLVENKDCDVTLTLGDGIHATGYVHQISKRKKKSYFCLLGIWFSPDLINPLIQSKLAEHKESKDELDEIRLGTISYPMLYIDRITGNLFTCSCFDERFDIGHDIERFLPYGNSEEGLRNRVKNIRVMEHICHFCNGGIPKQEYGHKMYYSSFLQRYLPYHKLLSRLNYDREIYEGEEYRQVENELREQFGFPKVGQQWVTETTLYKMVCMIFPDHEVIHHYRGNELEGLELDIWLPDLKLGIEYQGEQHYKVIEHWGGQEGLEKRIANDKKKKRLCKKLNYYLIEIKYTEEISEALVKKKVAKLGL